MMKILPNFHLFQRNPLMKVVLLRTNDSENCSKHSLDFFLHFKALLVVLTGYGLFDICMFYDGLQVLLSL
ncbi:hypothetical protein RchiOBHm_Chr5g0079901 [Rosa chinensis]|uniref:Uncharacterized protein n=1 Tax=Rosa chinensis TaxID=74649 RepID=A0A2P6QMP0_ROSCH|nr:hypothetical protein RchiOBHm_Chr5g0079901 [Rosa chinensis]